MMKLLSLAAVCVVGVSVSGCHEELCPRLQQGWTVFATTLGYDASSPARKARLVWEYDTGQRYCVRNGYAVPPRA